VCTRVHARLRVRVGVCGARGGRLAQEPKAEKQIYKHPKDFMRYTQNRLMRVYPGPLRVDSSNFNPSLYWAVGCQMVALNFQTAGVATQLNQVCGMCLRSAGRRWLLLWLGLGMQRGVSCVLSRSHAPAPLRAKAARRGQRSVCI
jgi:hypothetical protein